MIKVYCQDGDECAFVSCFCYDRTGETCNTQELNEGEFDSCLNCIYANENILFIQHDSERIIIETDEDNLDIKTCLYSSFYNFQSCGMVNPKIENCEDCRFWYENIEVDKIKKGD